MDPLHVHVGRETPIHLHVTDGKKRLSAKAAKISKSFSEMSAGRPSLRAQESLNKPTRLTWNSPSHTLQIQTPNRLSIRTPEGGSGAALQLSELTGSCGGVKGKTTELILETQEGGLTQEQLVDAKNRIRELESEVELERTMRRVEQRDKLSGQLSGLDLADTSCKVSRQETSFIRQQTREGIDSVRQLQERREEVLRKLLETELLSADSSKLSDKLRRIVQRVEREKSTNGSYGEGVGHELAELRDELLKTLVEFDACNASLRRMLRDQHEGEGRVKQALTQQELLLSRLKQSEENFSNQMRENELLDADLKSAKNTLKSVDRQFEYNSASINRLESQLNESHRDVERLREILLANERTGEESMHTFRVREDELKSKLGSSELEAVSVRGTLKTLQTQCDTLQQGREKWSREVRHKNEEVSRLSDHVIELQNKHSQVTRERAQMETDCGLYRDRVAELEGTLFQSKETAKTSLDSLSKRLLETTQDLNTSHIDRQRMEARLAGLQDRMSQQEQMADTRAHNANTEATQLQTSIGHFESLIQEYKSQIDELKRENLTLNSELAMRDSNLDRLRDEQRNSVELEKIRFQTKVAEIEPLPDLIREKDAKIQSLREKVSSLEELLSKQTLTLTDFSEREKGHLSLSDTTRERLYHVSGENKVFQDRVGELEKRVLECDQQNRDLIGISSKKEEALQRVQSRLEDVTNENISLSRQFESCRVESRRQVEQMREKLSYKDRATESNIADLEAQVAQLGATNSQLKRGKQDAERRYSTRVAEMKEKLEQANSSAKSMQSYIQFLKTSYASVFHDPTDNPTAF